MFWLHLGGEGSTSGLLGSLHAELANWLRGTLPPGPCHTQGRGPAGRVFLLVSELISSHPEAIGLHGRPPYRATGLARHTHCLSHIGAQTKLDKQLRQDVKHSL